MRIRTAIYILIAITILSGCSTSRQVMVAKMTPKSNFHTAALVPEAGNSPEMNSHMHKQLAAYGIKPMPSLPEGTRKSNKVDLIVTYLDVWRWDMVMYLSSITINLFDAPTGDLIVTGRWDNAVFHGFQKPQDVIKELMDDMFSKISAKKN